MARTYEELVENAIEMLDQDADLFCEMVDELDSWNGFADGFRVFNMYDLNDLYADRPVTDLLEDIGENHFDLSDEYFVDTIYGLRSIDDKYVEYSDNVSTEELFDNLLDNYSHLYLRDSEFAELMDEIYNFESED